MILYIHIYNVLFKEWMFCENGKEIIGVSYECNNHDDRNFNVIYLFTLGQLDGESGIL